MLYRADSAAAVAAFQRALSDAPSEIERCRAYIGMADAYRLVEGIDDGRRCLTRAEALLQPDGMEAERSRLYRISGSLKFASGEDSRPEQELALDYALRSGDLELEARAWSCLADAHYMAGETLRAQEHFARCIELCQRHGLQRVETYQHYMLGLSKWLGGDCHAAVRIVEHGLELARRSGHLRAEMVAHETLGLVLSDAGVFEQALHHFDLALTHARRMGSGMFAAAVAAERVEVLIRARREEEARAAARNLRADGFQQHWWFVRPMVTPMVAWLSPSHEEMNAVLEEEVTPTALPGGMMMMLFHSRAAETCLVRRNHSRASLHARALLDLNPDAKSLQRLGHQVLALVEYAQGDRDASLLQRIAALRAEAELGGFGTSVGIIDRMLATGEV
jgi:tetratricopeptide (TPR) repeat protein